MTDEEKEAVEYFKKRIDICIENANICDENDFDEEATSLRKEQVLIKTVLNLIKTQQEKIEYYKKQKDYKDKIIDEMADFIWTYDCCSHFAVNRVKCKMKGFETTLGNCKNDCIKDYFVKKLRDK